MCDKEGSELCFRFLHMRPDDVDTSGICCCSETERFIEPAPRLVWTRCDDCAFVRGWAVVLIRGVEVFSKCPQL
jgi:hypothetical protein